MAVRADGRGRTAAENPVRADPKSHSLADMAASRSTLEAFTSPCTTCGSQRSCRYSSARATCSAADTRRAHGIVPAALPPPWSRSCRFPFAANSSTSTPSSCWSQKARRRTMCGWRTRRSASSSWRNTRWRRSLLRWTLTAASAPPERRARYTVLNPPSPTTAEVNLPVIASTCAHDSPRGPASAAPLSSNASKPPSSSPSRSPAAALAPHPQQNNL
uniref:Uncharacterized protein n=1 Tax=Zea mays TaxID=4577 RepID=C4J3W6_MAIZE|nr:unknown [Zea mays]